jgi:hypothetical protein
MLSSPLLLKAITEEKLPRDAGNADKQHALSIVAASDRPL